MKSSSDVSKKRANPESGPRVRVDGARRVPRQELYLTPDGREKPDPTPVAPPIGYLKQPSMWEQMREMVRREMSAAAVASGAESFEEADDFDVGDDFDPTSPYEEVFDPTPISVLRERAAEAKRKQEQATEGGAGGGPGEDGGEAPPSSPVKAKVKKKVDPEPKGDDHS